MLKHLLEINQSFYERFDFVLHTEKKTQQLLKKYWKISLKQIQNSVVLEKKL